MILSDIWRSFIATYVKFPGDCLYQTCWNWFIFDSYSKEIKEDFFETRTIGVLATKSVIRRSFPNEVWTPTYCDCSVCLSVCLSKLARVLILMCLTQSLFFQQRTFDTHSSLVVIHFILIVSNTRFYFSLAVVVRTYVYGCYLTCQATRHTRSVHSIIDVRVVSRPILYPGQSISQSVSQPASLCSCVG